jgi:hypothetical protein
VGVALLAVSITLGPSGLLVARTTECVWEICVSNALMYGLGWIYALFCRIMAPDGILV